MLLPCIMKKRNIFGVILLIMVLFLMSACDTDPIIPEDNKLNTINGTVSDAGKPLEGVSVALLKDGVEIDSTLTNENGFYQFNNLEDGVYDLEFRKEGIDSRTKTVSVAAKGNVSEDIDISEFLTGTDVQSFVDDITNHGVRLGDTYQQQTGRIADNLEEVIPYLEALGDDIAYGTYFAETLFNNIDSWIDEPGRYDGNLERIDSGELDDYQWQFIIDEEESILLTISNLDEIVIIEEGRAIIDISKAYFDYQHIEGKSRDNAEYYFSNSLSFTNVSHTEELIFEITEEEVYIQEEEAITELVFIIPFDFNFNINGQLYSEYFSNIYGVEPSWSIMDLEIDSKLSKGSDQYLNINGNFESDYINLAGGLNIDFSYFPGIDEIDDGEIPVISKIELLGNLGIDVMETEGSFAVELKEEDGKVDLDKFIFDGIYNELNTEDGVDPVKADALIIVDLFFSEDKSGGNIIFEGYLDGEEFEEIEVELDSTYTDYYFDSYKQSEFLGSMSVFYGENQSLAGNIYFSEDEDIFTVNLGNELGLRIEIEIDLSTDEREEVIGHIKDDAGNKLADIIWNGINLDVNIYDTGTTTSLLF